MQLWFKHSLCGVTVRLRRRVQCKKTHLRTFFFFFSTASRGSIITWVKKNTSDSKYSGKYKLGRTTNTTHWTVCMSLVLSIGSAHNWYVLKHYPNFMDLHMPYGGQCPTQWERQKASPELKQMWVQIKRLFP